MAAATFEERGGLRRDTFDGTLGMVPVDRARRSRDASRRSATLVSFSQAWHQAQVTVEAASVRNPFARSGTGGSSSCGSLIDGVREPNIPVEVGFYGKLPSHGDFLRRRVSDAFVGGWDAWLQECLAASRAALGERWLDVYLTSPAWRFVCAAGRVRLRAASSG